MKKAESKITIHTHKGWKLPSLLTEIEVQKLSGVDSRRILELAEQGYAPCVRIDNGKPKFFGPDILPWIKQNLFQVQEGQPLPDAKKIKLNGKESIKTPPDLLPIADKLLEIPVITFPCVYFLIRNDRVQYVGLSRCFHARMGQHLGVKEFDRILIYPCSDENLEATEVAFIEQFKPPLNSKETYGNFTVNDNFPDLSMEISQ